MLGAATTVGNLIAYWGSYRDHFYTGGGIGKQNYPTK